MAATFPVTLWPQVLKARDGNGGEAAEALAALCRLYRYPVYAFIRRKGKAHHEAEDLTQEFSRALSKRSSSARWTLTRDGSEHFC